MASIETTNRRFKAVDYLWVGVALLAHAMLLLMPFSMPREVAPKPETISVTFIIPPQAEPPEEQPVESQLATTQPDIMPEKKPASITPEPIEPQEQVPEPLLEPLLDTIQALPKPVSTARLLQSAADFNLSTPEKDKSRTLGTFSAPPLPANFTPSLEIDENLFDGTMATAGSEVMDEWVDASGGYNVVVKTPSGRVLCGQAQPYSSMNPLVEHVTMWQSCGGDGKKKTRRRR